MLPCKNAVGIRFNDSHCPAQLVGVDSIYVDTNKRMELRFGRKRYCRTCLDTSHTDSRCPFGSRFEVPQSTRLSIESKRTRARNPVMSAVPTSTSNNHRTPNTPNTPLSFATTTSATRSAQPPLGLSGLFSDEDQPSNTTAATRILSPPAARSTTTPITLTTSRTANTSAARSTPMATAAHSTISARSSKPSGAKSVNAPSLSNLFSPTNSMGSDDEGSGKMEQDPMDIDSTPSNNKKKSSTVKKPAAPSSASKKRGKKR